MKIAFIGMGEAGAAFVSGWGPARAGDIAAWDIKLDDPATAPEIEARCAALGIACAGSGAEALAGADLVFCTVTADQAVAAARAQAPHIAPGAAWLDLNSCAPAAKRESEAMIRAAGGRYLDVAVMQPVLPARNRVACLISGPDAADLEPVLAALPMNIRRVEGPTGAASTIKMIRSVFVKGMEALTSECVLAAVRADVADEVLPSLLEGHPGIDVERHAATNFERMLAHGARRAAEMEEVARTLADLGLPNEMSAGAAAWEARVVATGLEPPADPQAAGARALAAAILPRLARP